MAPGTHRKRRMSQESSSTRHYVDPWDLENYVYLERHYAQDPVDELYCLPSSVFNGLEEADFSNDRYNSLTSDTASHHNYDCYQSYADVAVPRFSPRGGSELSDSCELGNARLDCELYSPSVMMRKATTSASDASLVYVYEAGGRKRKMALPKGHFGFENRRDLGGYSSREADYMSGDDVGSLLDYDVTHHSYDEEEEIYSSKPVAKFHLTRYGHLKIDYSISWSSLGRFIGSD